MLWVFPLECAIAAAVRPLTVTTILDAYEAIQCGIPDLEESISLLRRQIK
jgi:hypothetical protein